MANVFNGDSDTCLVSIIMPAFNAADTIVDAIRSSLGQTQADLELIVIDDASTDDTALIASRYALDDCRVRVLTMAINSGPAAARNVGLDAARGRWIALLDADDLYASSRLERLLTLAEANGADIVSDNLVITVHGGDASPYLLISRENLPAPRQLYAAAFVEGNNGGARGRHESYGFMQPMFLRAFIERHAVRYDARNRFGEDYLFCLRCLRANARWWITPEAMYQYRVRANSASARQSSNDLKRISLAEFNLLSDPDIRRDPDLVAALRRHIMKIDHSYYYRVFTDALKAHRFRSAAALLFTSADSLRSVISESLVQAPIVIRKVFRGGYGNPPTVEDPVAAFHAGSAPAQIFDGYCMNQPQPKTID